MSERFELIGDERDISGNLRLAYGSGPDDPTPFVLTLTPQYVAGVLGKAPPVTINEIEKYADHRKWSMVDLYALDQSRLIARQDRTAADRFAEGFAFPFEICFRSVDGFMRVSQRVIHASGGGCENHGNGVDSDTRSAHN